MTISDIAKIQSLIASSKLLNQKEREEWLALLDLMNDKQLMELERILSSEVIVSEIQKSAKSDAGKSPLPNPPPQGEGTGQQSQMPKLSHIMNLPNVASFNRAHTPPPVAQQPKPVPKSSAFSAKLKAIFSEKELPAGHPLPELELEAGKPQPVKSEPVRLPERKLPPPVPPKPKTPAPAAPKLADAPRPSAPAAPLGKKDEVLDHALGLRPKLADLEPVTIKPLPKMPEQVAPKVISPLKEEKVRPVTQPVAKPTAALVDAKINTLDDLAALEPKALSSAPVEALVKKIKGLITLYGYFETVFHIEKSPAYKNYIKTGLKMLAEGESFVNTGEPGGYLSKEQFEQFADMLAKIQAS